MYFTFDVLTLHPKPERRESLTSYFAWLAAINGIPNVYVLSQMLDTNLGHQVTHPDYPLLDYTKAAHATGRQVDELRRLTFDYFSDKFGRGDSDQRTGPLLRDAIAPYLRWCPHCLADKPHYWLPWRFTLLAGCPHHHTRLLDHCPHCKQTIPLFRPPFATGACPTCQAPLAEMPAPSLSEAERQQVAVIFDDLTFLLAPHDWDAATVFRGIGLWLAFQRKLRCLEATDVAIQLEISAEYVKGMENTRTNTRRGERFHHYAAYAAFLGLSLRELFTTVRATLAADPDFPDRTLNELMDSHYLARVQAAVAELETQASGITLTAIGRAVGMGIPTLRYYPHTRAYLAQFSDPERLAEQREEIENELYRQVEDIIATIQTTSKRVSLAEVARYLDRTPEGLRTYPRVRAMIRQVTADDALLYEPRLLRLAQQAIAELESQGELVTQAAVGRLMDISPEQLKRFPSTTELMAQIARNFELYQQQRGAEVLALVQEAVHYLVTERELVERKAIAMYVGMADISLNHYAEVRAYIREVLAEYAAYNTIVRRERRDAELIAAIDRAAAYLHAHGESVTEVAIEEHLPVTLSAVRRRPKVYAHLQATVERLF